MTDEIGVGSAFNGDKSSAAGPDGKKKPVDELLGRKNMIDAAVDIVLKVDAPFTLGIYGGWGTGKTHFLESMQDAIDRKWNDSPPQAITIWYEAWKHQSEENPAVSMLACARDVLLASFPAIDSPKRAAFKRTIFNALKSMGKLLPKVEATLPPPIKVVVEPSAFVAEIEERNRDDEREAFENPERQTQLAKVFEDVLTAMADYGGGDYRLVFFIDDLDRCLPEVIVEVLEKIKLFMWHEKCVFVIGADDEMVEHSVSTRKGYSGKNAQEMAVAKAYLEKIVNFPYVLPPAGKESLEKFIGNKLEKLTGKDEEKEAILAILVDASDEAHASLRRMIQLANTMILNDYLGRASIKESYDVEIMAIVTALQVLHQDVLQQLCRDTEVRGPRLKAFFGVKDDRTDPTVDFLGDRADSVTRLSNRAEKIKASADDPLEAYVEFLSPASASREGSLRAGATSDSRFEWFEKDVTIITDKPYGDLGGAVEWIKANWPPAGDQKTLVAIDGYDWRVLEVDEQNQRALLITERVVGRGPLDEIVGADYRYEEETWITCLMKRVLNEAWLYEKLPELSKEGRIVEGVEDEEGLGKVFLLSGKEAMNDQYFKGNDDRVALTISRQSTWWWLRSPGTRVHRAANVYGDGSVSLDGSIVDYDNRGVRPALWLNLKSDNL